MLIILFLEVVVISLTANVRHAKNTDITLNVNDQGNKANSKYRIFCHVRFTNQKIKLDLIFGYFFLIDVPIWTY